MNVATKDLKPGMRVNVWQGRVRTVSRVVDSGYVNYRDEPILYVYYEEGKQDGWSDGNSSNESGLWEVLE